MTILYREALAELEGALGPVAAGGPLGHAAALERDELEEFPVAALDELGRLELWSLQIPKGAGGRFVSFEQLLALSWALGRRDPVVALSQGMQTWFWLARLAGDERLCQRADALLRVNASPCFAASEAAHGADLVAGDTLAVERPSGWQVTGEKWPIGRARHAPMAFVLARTRSERSARSLSWFALDTEAVGVERLPKVRTLGLRGADLSGLSMREAPATLVGREGQGLELTLEIFQITRPLVASLALGAADTALRAAVVFALERRLYRDTAAALPAVREELAQAWLDLIAAEILLLATLRGLHFAPRHASVTAPLAKALAPRLAVRALEAATRVLGARAFLRDGPQAIVQKMARDQQAAVLIDGSGPVCLHAVAAQLPLLLAADGGPSSRASWLRLDQPVPTFEPGALQIVARGPDDVMRAARPDVLAALDELRQRVKHRHSHESSGAAQRYATLYAVTCCREFQHFNADLLENAERLPELGAERLLGADLSVSDRERVFERLVDTVQHGRSLSVTGVAA